MERWHLSCFPVRLLLDELERLRPDIVAACRRALAEANDDADFTRLGKEAFRARAPPSGSTTRSWSTRNTRFWHFCSSDRI